MDLSKIGSLIQKLRKEKGFTQKELAEILMISDKAISKWERGLGCPDISLISDLSKALGVDIEKMLSGELNEGEMLGGNMKNTTFYVCKSCGNIVTGNGELTASCCGRKLEVLTAKKEEEGHEISVEKIEHDLYITSDHPMKKEHYVSFVAFVTGDKLLIAKQYPEWGLQVRFQKFGHGKLYYYCTEHGLFYKLI